MENALQAILDNLPPRRRRSKLEPYAALIRALRARGRSYREIVTILRDRCGLRVATHTVYHFVRSQAQKKSAVRRARRHPPAPARPCFSAGRIVTFMPTRRPRRCVGTHRGRQAARAGIPGRRAESLRIRREHTLGADGGCHTAEEVTRCRRSKPKPPLQWCSASG
jgi:hypothetical protein